MPPAWSKFADPVSVMQSFVPNGPQTIDPVVGVKPVSIRFEKAKSVAPVKVVVKSTGEHGRRS